MPTTFLDDLRDGEALYADWPLIRDTLTCPWPHEPWQMEYYERLTLAGVVGSLRPALTIEVGTRGGGSLALFAHYSARTISIDLEPASHDSFNPACRQGILDAPWAESPFVHLVEVDFQHGSIFDRTDPPGQMWGGLFLAVLQPTPRTGPLTISERHRALFDLTRRASAHQAPTLRHRIGRRLQRVGLWQQAHG
jgi:hypothetical protein